MPLLLQPFQNVRYLLPRLNALGDIPGGPVVKNLPANAQDMGSNPALGRFQMPQGSYANGPQLLSLRSSAQVLQLLKPVRSTAHTLQQKKPLQIRSLCMETRVTPACDN